MTNKVLYRRKNLGVEFDPKKDGHWFYIGEAGYFLDRSILEELACTEAEDIRKKLRSVNDLIVENLHEKGISMETAGYVFARARITELEEERNYFMRETQQ